MSDNIEHEGIIISIDGSKAQVRIEQSSACAGCHAKGACSAFDKSEKIIDAIIDDNTVFMKGERVVIYGEKRIGIKAVIIAFVAPFIIVATTLALALSYTNNEGISALISLASLIPYFSVVFLMRKKLQREFKFYIRKIS